MLLIKAFYRLDCLIAAIKARPSLASSLKAEIQAINDRIDNYLDGMGAV